MHHGSIRTQKVTTALCAEARAPTLALMSPVALSPGEAIVPSVVAGAPQLLRWRVLPGMLSLMNTAVMPVAVVLVAVMRYAMHWPGAVFGPAGIGAVE